ncbi:MAG: DUF3750 domain-containing protein [Burkholderiaceae bacterium]
MKSWHTLRLLPRLCLAIAVSLVLLLLGPLSVLAFGELTARDAWRQGSRDSSGQSPDPATHDGAVVQVFAARTLGWRGAFGVHTWLATKRAGAPGYRVHHVIGWRYYYGGSAVVSQSGVPDFHWFGARPTLLADHRGARAEAMIDAIEAAVQAYPYADLYRVWPGPNSNTFTAWVARQVPELELDLPPNALGKDFLGQGRIIAPMPSGTGWQLSLYGLVGAGVARKEGIEVNLLGLAAGFDLDDLAWRIPGWAGYRSGHWPARRIASPADDAPADPA